MSSKDTSPSTTLLVSCMLDVKSRIPWHLVPDLENVEPQGADVNEVNINIQTLARSHPQLFAERYMIYASTPTYFPLSHLLCSNDSESCTTQTIRAVIEAFPDAVRIPNSQDETLPIHVACSHNGCTVDTLRLLYEVYPASALASRQKNGDTPLHIVCFRRRWKLAQYLVRVCPQAAAIPDHKDRYPLHLLVGRFIHPHQYRHMDEEERGLMRDTLLAVIRADPSIARISVKNGPLRRGKNACGTPLHEAVQQGFHKDVVVELLKAYPRAVHNLPMSCWNRCSLDVSLLLTKYYLAEREVAVDDDDHHRPLPLSYTDKYPLHALLQSPAVSAYEQNNKRHSSSNKKSFLLSTYKNQLDQLDGDGCLPFHIAIQNKHPKVALEILKGEPRAGTTRHGMLLYYPFFLIAEQSYKDYEDCCKRASVYLEMDWIDLIYSTLRLDPEIWLQKKRMTMTEMAATTMTTDGDDELL